MCLRYLKYLKVLVSTFKYTEVYLHVQKPCKGNKMQRQSISGYGI